jgi:hypothetical protein
VLLNLLGIASKNLDKPYEAGASQSTSSFFYCVKKMPVSIGRQKLKCFEAKNDEYEEQNQPQEMARIGRHEQHAKKCKRGKSF